MFYFYHRYLGIQHNYTSKISYSFRFILIFFYMLKKISNISNYSIFKCFVFFFQSKKVSLIFNCGFIYFLQSKKMYYIFLIVPSISRFSLKRYLTFYLCFFFYFFFLSLELFIITCCENYFKKCLKILLLRRLR